MCLSRARPKGYRRSSNLNMNATASSRSHNRYAGEVKSSHSHSHSHSVSPKMEVRNHLRSATDPIRARYLHSLNMLSAEQPLAPCSTGPGTCNATSPPGSIKNRLDISAVRVESLKSDYGKPDETIDLSSSSSSSTSIPSLLLSRRSFSQSSMSTADDESDDGSLNANDSARRRTRGVSFDATVTVKPIPMRTEYSNRIRRHLWSDPRELSANAQRNIVEYAAERHDWRLVLEEDQMYVDARTGEKVHPVHYARYLQAQQQSNRKENFLDMSRRAAQRWSHNM